MKSGKAIFLAAMLAIILLVPLGVQAKPLGGPGGSGEAKAYGTTFGEMSAAWWTWVGKLPTANHPLTTDGPVDCSLGQIGPIWFLAGVTSEDSGDSVERTCTVPNNRALFYPLINGFWINLEGDDSTVEDKREELDFLFDILNPLSAPPPVYPCNLSSMLDGEPTQHLYPIVRIQSPPFHLLLNNNLFDPPYPIGSEDSEAVSDGYWVLIPPLAEGEHTIQIHGGLCDSSDGSEFFEVDVTYILTVVSD